MIFAQKIDDIKKINALKAAIENKKAAIKAQFDELEKQIDELSTITFKVENEYKAQNPLIVKRVIKYIAAGMTKDDAIRKTADDFDTAVFRVSVVYDQSKKYMTALNLYAKKYAIEKLKTAGFSARKMSEIIGVSIQSIYKIIKCPVDLWRF